MLNGQWAKRVGQSTADAAAAHTDYPRPDHERCVVQFRSSGPDIHSHRLNVHTRQYTSAPMFEPIDSAGWPGLE